MRSSISDGVWLWTIVFATAALGWWSFIQQIIFGRSFGSNPAPDWGVWLLWLAIGLGLPLLFGRMILVLEVTRGEVAVRFRGPRIQRGDGVRRLGIKMAYNVGGNRGVDLTLRDGRGIMLGSQRPDELAEAIETQRRIPDRRVG